VLGAPHGEELAVAPWPVLVRERVRRRRGTEPRSRWLLLVVVLVGLLSSNVLFTVFVVALPTVAGGLHTSVPTVTWVVTAPMLAVAVAVPLAGKLSDRVGHRRAYLAGMVGNVVVAVASALAPDVGSLVAARALGGVVGAALSASSMALVLGAFAPGERVKAMGWWSLVGAGGPVIGVAVGGPLIATVGWRALFLLEMVLGALALVAAVVVIPEHGTAQRRAGGPLDWPGAVVVVVTVGALLFGLNRGPLLGFGSVPVLVAFGLAGAGLVVVVPLESRRPDPLLPVHYLRRPNFVFPLGAQALANFAYMGGFFLSPLLLEQVYGHGESAAGLLVIPRPLTFSLVAPLAGYAAVRVGERTAAVVGTTAVVASMAAFAVTSAGAGLVLVEAALVLSGVGMGVASPSISASIANVVDQDALGAASAAQQLLVQLATVAGIQVLQSVMEVAAHGHPSGEAQLPAFHAAFVVGGAVALGGVALAARVRSTARAANGAEEPAGTAEIRVATILTGRRRSPSVSRRSPRRDG
jgi:EmrB/QacA subfamily drug resistance transporter